MPHTSDPVVEEFARRVSDWLDRDAVDNVYDQDGLVIRNMTRATWDFLRAVAIEIERANEKHTANPRTTARKWFSNTAEEMVELCQAWNDNVDTDAEILDAEPIKTEAVQVAAMCARLWRALP
jgi:hypothetical protein